MWKLKNSKKAQGLFGFGNSGGSGSPSPAPSPSPSPAPAPAPTQSPNQVALGELGSMFAPPAPPAPAPGASPAAPATFYSITPEHLDAGLAQFSPFKSMDPALVTKALSGDTEAFGQVMDSAVRTAVASSVKAAMKLTEEAVTKRFSEFSDKTLPEFLQKQKVTDAVNKNSVFANPAMKPFTDQYIAALAAKHPQATQEQLQQETERHFAAMKETFLGGTPSGEGNGNPSLSGGGNGGGTPSKPFDWDGFLSQP